MLSPLSPKQTQTLKEATARINIWVGAVRSGKTFSSILALIMLLKEGPLGSAMILGASRESIQRNVMVELCGLLGIPPPASKTNEMTLFGRTIHLVGAHDERAVSRIQGSTLALAYVDEATVLPAPVWRMLLSRLSVRGAKLLATCNPAGPAHWLKRDFIDREGLDLKTWTFTLDDNPALDDSYKESLKKEYTGMWYARYILGQWAAAEGLVYDGFNPEDHVSEECYQPQYRIAGLDYGIVNPTACVLIGINPNRWPQIWIEDEYYFNSSEAIRGKTDLELSNDIKDFLRHRKIEALYCDPSAASLKLELMRRDLPVMDANNDVLTGISVVQKFMNHHNLVINARCKNLIDELQSYSWDPKAAERGIDAPIKKGDHLSDALRYGLASCFPEGEINSRDDLMASRAAYQEVYSDPMGGLFAGSGYF